jgi:hypothetical protein
MSEPKEPHFFTTSKYDLGADGHNSLFGRRESVLAYGESSTDYFASKRALELISKSIPDIRIIVILREPVDRSISDYRFYVRNGRESRPLLKAIEDELARAPGHFGGYINNSRYCDHVKAWRQTLGQDRVLVVKTQELAEHRQELVDACCAFLGLPSFIASEEVRENVGVEILTFPKLITSVSWLVPRTIKTIKVYRKLRTAVGKAVTPKPTEMTSVEYSRLREILQPDIQFYGDVRGPTE